MARSGPSYQFNFARLSADETLKRLALRRYMEW